MDYINITKTIGNEPHTHIDYIWHIHNKSFGLNTISEFKWKVDFSYF